MVWTKIYARWSADDVYNYNDDDDYDYDDLDLDHQKTLASASNQAAAATAPGSSATTCASLLYSLYRVFFLTGTPPKNLKYVKPRLGESTLT